MMKKFRISGRVSAYIAWVNMWIGARVNRDEAKLFIQIIPCIGLEVYFGPNARGHLKKILKDRPDAPDREALDYINNVFKNVP